MPKKNTYMKDIYEEFLRRISMKKIKISTLDGRLSMKALKIC